MFAFEELPENYGEITLQLFENRFYDGCRLVLISYDNYKKISCLKTSENPENRLKNASIAYKKDITWKYKLNVNSNWAGMVNYKNKMKLFKKLLKKQSFYFWCRFETQVILIFNNKQ